MKAPFLTVLKTELLSPRHPIASPNSDLASGRSIRKHAQLQFAALLIVTASALAADPAPPTPPPAPPTAAPTGAVAAPAKPSGAKIQFATPIYDFGKITAGEAVNYTYIFTNTGTETLTLTSVAPSCGCTTAGDWSHNVEPGKTGNIPIRFASGNFSGPVGKSVTVKCNDPAQETVVLQIKGTLWQAIEVNPRYAMLNATTESASTSVTVHITNNTEQAMIVFPPESNNKAFAAELSTNQPGKGYELVVKTVPPLAAGNVTGIITLKTSVTNMPTISITAFVNVQPVVTVNPPSITLAGGPLAQPVTSVVTIRNSSTNALALSEPAINVKGVDVQLKELEPGKSFTATLSFPAGFEIAAGTQVELSLKSNHAQSPVLKVPVQQQRPAAPPGAATQTYQTTVLPAVPPPAAK
jgi:hypothetical protein